MTHIDATWLPEIVLFLVYASSAARPTPVRLILYLQLKVKTLNRPQHHSVIPKSFSSRLKLTDRWSLIR